MTALHADRGGQRGKAQIERHELHLDAALLLLVGEGLAHAVAAEIGGVGQSDLVVLVVGDAAPEANGVDARRSARAIRPCSVTLVWCASMRVLWSSPSMPGNVIERVVLRDRDADEAVVEDVRAADRLAVGAQRRVRLPAR